jgi:hypothetical protein
MVFLKTTLKKVQIDSNPIQGIKYICSFFAQIDAEHLIYSFIYVFEVKIGGTMFEGKWGLQD